jgi:hypothetical protein
MQRLRAALPIHHVPARDRSASDRTSLRELRDDAKLIDHDLDGGAKRYARLRQSSESHRSQRYCFLINDFAVEAASRMILVILLGGAGSQRVLGTRSVHTGIVGVAN